MNQVAKIEPDVNQNVIPMAATPMALLEAAVTKGAGIDVIEKLMALQERYDANQARKAFDEAMAAAKAEIPIIAKNRTVDFISLKGTRTHYRHEDLAEIARTVNPILGKYGLSYRFRTSANVNEPVSVTCIVTHRLGYYEENTLVGPRDETGNKNSLQQVGSTLTYLQRMTLKAALGLAAAEDDDGQEAGGSTAGGTVVEAISNQQEETLLSLIEQTGTDFASFCRYFKVGRLSDLPTKSYQAAFDNLQKRLRLREQKAAQSGGDDFPGDRK